MSLKDLSRRVEELRHVARPDQNGMRLDHLLSEWITWRSRNDLQARIRAGTILLNGVPAKAAARIRPGDVIVVKVEAPPGDAAVDAESIPLVIIHEEPLFVVLDKPAGAVIHPVGKYVLNTLMNVLHARYRRPDDPAHDVIPMVVHRLDKETSGVLVIAKDEEARRFLGAAFESRAVGKEYLAIVSGNLEHDQEIDLAIGPDPAGSNKTRVACVVGGRPSHTTVRVEERFPGATLVRCLPHTGRQHQIRVHLKTIGHPILGDPLYGAGAEVRAKDLRIPGLDPDEIVLRRQALHAARLTIPHPTTGAALTFEAPLAPDLMQLCARLRTVPAE